MAEEEEEEEEEEEAFPTIATNFSSVMPPWSMVSIRDNQPITVFPPVNHENLQILTNPSPVPEQFPEKTSVLSWCRDHQRDPGFCSDLDSDSDTDSDSVAHSNSSSTFSPLGSSQSSPLNSSPNSSLFVSPKKIRSSLGVTTWVYSWMEILCSKVRDIMSNYASIRGPFSTLRSTTFTMALLGFLYFHCRRKLWLQQNNRVQLIHIINEKDQKINQLLDQIARLNQVLLGLHNVPDNSAT